MISPRPHCAASAPSTRERHRQQDDERQRDALVLRRQRQIDEQQAEAEDDHRLAARRDFFTRQARPLERHALRQRAPREAFHQLQRLTRLNTRAPRRR